MDARLFKNSTSGKVIRTKDGYWAFLPNPLPPKLVWDAGLSRLISEASLSLGTLKGLGETLPNPHLLIYPFIRREAVLSSRIEGTISSLSDLLLFEATQIEKQKDVREVHNYVKALEYGIRRLKDTPLNLKLVSELHGILMKDVRGGRANPGKFRDKQNWIGLPGQGVNQAIYVPPPPSQMKKALGQLKRSLLSQESLPSLIHAALLHYQFEAIHPFLDGNGRVGRLLIILYLHQHDLLPKPLLYLSAFFERHRSHYYGQLLDVSRRGAWRSWIEFFLRGVITQSRDAVQKSRLLVNLQQDHRREILAKHLSPTAARVLDLIFMRPVINIDSAAKALNLTFPAVSKAVNQLEGVRILKETTGKKRNKIYVAQRILKVLEE